MFIPAPTWLSCLFWVHRVLSGSSKQSLTNSGWLARSARSHDTPCHSWDSCYEAALQSSTPPSPHCQTGSPHGSVGARNSRTCEGRPSAIIIVERTAIGHSPYAWNRATSCHVKSLAVSSCYHRVATWSGLSTRSAYFSWCSLHQFSKGCSSARPYFSFMTR